MIFTKEDYEKIEEYLKWNSKRDTDFEYLESYEILPLDTIALVHDARNYKTQLQDIFLSRVYTDLYDEQRADWEDKVQELQDLIDTLKIDRVHITDTFGDSDIAGISQKTLTKAFDDIWKKLEDITGEVYRGISMIITPSYFIGEDGCNIHITASTEFTNGTFENISFYGNGQLIALAENQTFFEYDTTILETTVFECIATILGKEYHQQKTVIHYNSFYLGAGTAYSDIMDVDHVIPITKGMRGAYDIDILEGQHIIVVVGENLLEGFIRADLNGFEIPFNEQTVTVDGNNYKVFTSINTYNAGKYNIDING